MKNCIFVCLFNNENMIEMLYLFLESIYLYGKLDENTEFLVYTSTEFMNIIKRSKLYNEKINFEINDTYNDVEKACKSRLDFFNLSSSKNYSRVLYLDLDIIVKDDLNKVFCLAERDILYVLEEGTIEHDYWGGPLFNHAPVEYTDKTAFTTGIILFNNSPLIRLLFEQIIIDMKTRICEFATQDQPYIVYSAFRYKMYDNKKLKNYVINHFDYNITYKNKTIYHFPGSPGEHGHKLVKLKNFLETIKTDNFLENVKCRNVDIYEDVWTVSEKMRIDISDFFIDKSHYKIAEVGSYKGYTTRVLSSIFSQVYAIDNQLEWLQMNINFNKDKTNITYLVLDIYKDNWEILPGDADVVFIDACHGYEECKSDIINSLKTFKNLKYVICDDYGVAGGVKQIVDELLENHVFILESFVGLKDVPDLYGIVKDVNEGVICRVNHGIKAIENCEYVWQDASIKFLENFIMDAFGNGYYAYINDHSILANFGSRRHVLVFKEDYSEFISTREDDKEIVIGKIIRPNSKNMVNIDSKLGEQTKEIVTEKPSGIFVIDQTWLMSKQR